VIADRTVNVDGRTLLRRFQVHPWRWRDRGGFDQAVKVARGVAGGTPQLQAVQSTAEEMFDAAKDQLTSTLQAGQDAIRPARVTPDRR
jgi:CHASE3 domain sensor protein